MPLRVGSSIFTSAEFTPRREKAEGECPQCGFTGPHPVVGDEDGNMQGQCQECYQDFTVDTVPET